MITNRLMRALLAAILCLSATATLAQTPQLTPGEYLSEDYMAKIKSTRSPDESLIVPDPCMISVSAEADGIELMEIWDFHEGGATFLLLPSGSLHVKQDAGEDRSDIAFTLLSNTDFTFGTKSNKPQHFVYVGTAEKWVANQIIVGKYKDKKGNRYEFGPDGIAHFPDRTFKYTMGLDWIGPPDGDYIYGETDGKLGTWVFKIKGDKLKLFQTTENDEVVRKPMYVLQKIEQPKHTNFKSQPTKPISTDEESSATTP